jgi:hypothetical protein
MSDTYTITDDKIETLKNWEKFCYEKTLVFQGDGPDGVITDPEAHYHLGAFHAFRDALDVLKWSEPDVEESDPLNKAALVFGAAVTVGAGYLAWKKREVIKAWAAKHSNPEYNAKVWARMHTR